MKKQQSLQRIVLFVEIFANVKRFGFLDIYLGVWVTKMDENVLKQFHFRWYHSASNLCDVTNITKSIPSNNPYFIYLFMLMFILFSSN